MILEYKKQYEIIKSIFEKMGYKVTEPKEYTSKGVDMHIIRDNKYVFSVEIKEAGYTNKSKNNFRTRKVLRPYDDLIAIVFPSGYILIEPMKDHLRNCNKSGDRHFVI